MAGYHPAMPQRYRGIAFVCIATAGLLLIAVGSSVDRRGGLTQVAAPAAAVAAPEVGAPAPDFALQTPDGETIRLSDLRGQAVLINFWATWCGPCRSEMPAIQGIYDQQRERGFTVIAVNMREDPDRVHAFIQDLGLSFPVALDLEGAVARSYRVVNIPASFFIDRHGVVRARYLGPMSRAVMEASLDGLLP
ncbi:MAG: hypothetical protein KatS3mg057_1340 [Herpetosiphonaceae bacterium]|nr:MAG: hypothetical protein KatS3mg057_1340 [Herpetosiphonaceae bacterium]